MEIQWSVEKLISDKKSGGVVRVEWNSFVKETRNQEILVASRSGEVEFAPDPSSSDFIAFENLSENDVLSWVWSSVDKNSIETELKKQIEDFEAQPETLTTEEIPWQM